MTKKPSDQFRLGTPKDPGYNYDKEPISGQSSGISKDQHNNLYIDKGNRKRTSLAIIMCLLFGILILYFYMDIKDSIVMMQEGSTSKTQNLIKDFEPRFSDFSSKQDELKKAMDKKIAILEKKTSRALRDIKKTKNELNTVSTKTVDKKKLGDEIAIIRDTLKGRIDKLETRLKEIQTYIKAIDKDVALDLGAMTEAINKSTKAAQKSEKKISLLENSLSKLNRETAKERKDEKTSNSSLENEIGKIKKGLKENNNNINILHMKIIEMMKILREKKDISESKKDTPQSSNKMTSTKKMPSTKNRMGLKLNENGLVFEQKMK